MALGLTGQLEAVVLEPKHWSNAHPIRAIFKAAFEAADLPYFNPHSLRNTDAELPEAAAIIAQKIIAEMR